MTLDEAIAQERENAKTQRDIAEECFEEHIFDEKERIEHLKYAEEYEQLAEWLEELKKYREIGTVEECKNSVLKILEAYNKAIEDFSERIKQVTYTSGTESDGYYKIHAICERDIDEIAEQLKGGDGE